MQLWELLSFLLLCIVVGAVVCSLVFRLIGLFLPEHEAAASSGTLVLPITYTKQETPPASEERLALLNTNLLVEIETNLELAGRVWTGELKAFDTHAWDEEQFDLYDLPTFLRNDLRQAYETMHLANQIVWLSKEFNRSSHDMDETYQGMRTIIAEKLSGIKQNRERTGFGDSSQNSGYGT